MPSSENSRRSQMLYDIYDDVFDTMRSWVTQSGSVESQALRLTEKIAKHIGQEWIPVGERLPERTCHVIARCRGGQAMEYVHAGGEFTRHGEKRNVTHWMPLPEPPTDVTEQT
jgi:hypothetical protein